MQRGQKNFRLDIFVRRVIMKIARDAAISGRPSERYILIKDQKTVTWQSGGFRVSRLTIARAAAIMKTERDTATSGRPIQMRSFLSELRNRHLAEWRFLLFTIIVTVKEPICKVIRMVSPPFGWCGRPPAVCAASLNTIVPYHVKKSSPPDRAMSLS